MDQYGPMTDIIALKSRPEYLISAGKANNPMNLNIRIRLISAAVLLAGMAVLAARADAAVRVAPIIKAPVTLPAVGMPLYPFPIERPTWPSLPMTLGTSLPKLTTLPSVSMPVVLPSVSLPAGVPANPMPVPAEKPSWPVLPTQVAFVGVERAPQLPTTRSGDSSSGRQNIPEEAFDELVEVFRGGFGMRKKEDKKPTAKALNAAFDGRAAEPVPAAVDAREDDGYVEPRPSRPTIGRVRRQGLPEDELLRDIGVQ